MNNQKIILLKNHESRSLKFYLTIFYIIYIAFDILSYHLLTNVEPYLGHMYEIWLSGLVLILLPVAYALSKKGYQSSIKYVYFISYSIVSLLVEVMNFKNGGFLYSANIAEHFWLLLSPIFINRTYFMVVSLVSIVKYLVILLLLQVSGTSVFLFFSVIVSVIGYLLLVRNISYINAIEKTYIEINNKEKLATIGKMATAIGHEIRNPLASLKGFTQLLMEKYKDNQEYSKIMLQEVERIDTISNNLLVLGRPSALVIDKHSPSILIDHALKQQKLFIQQNRIQVTCAIADNSPDISCDKNRVIQVISNLIKISIETMPDGGSLQISSRLEGTEFLIFQLEDTGVWANEKREATDLALLVSQKIIEEHGGSIHYHRHDEKGTTATICLPL